MIHSREDLSLAQRVVIKAGTSVVSTPDGFPCLSRIANIVENTASLVRQGKEVLIVTSGAVGIGRQRLKKQAMLRQSMSDVLSQRTVDELTLSSIPAENGKISYSSACAAAGQLGLMSLYETMFNQYDIQTSQLLVTAFDFTSPERRRNIQYVISQLLKLGIVPLLNENDAVSANQGYQLFGNSFADNDSLAALVSIEMSAQLLILLTDVNGVYDRPPKEQNAQLIDVFKRNATDFKIGDKSLQGRGGMGAKVDAALRAVDGGVMAVIIASGSEHEIVDKVLKGQKAGTAFFLHETSTTASTGQSDSGTSSSAEIIISSNGTDSVISAAATVEVTHVPVETFAINAREGYRQLNAVGEDVRKKILLDIASSLQAHESEIMAANVIDMELAEKSGIDNQALKRLKLTSEKLAVLVSGITAIAESDACLGRTLGRTELADGLILDKVSCSLGVLLIIFESRPDCLPQIAALAIKSGNGLVLKGGKEAEKSNTILHRIIVESIEKVSQGAVNGGVFGLVTRAEIPSLLKLDDLIDLVIPRGSSDLVKYIKDNTKIPVMGHSEGVCHVFIDRDACYNKAQRIVIDSKTDYPSACNAAECLLLHEDLIHQGFVDTLLRALRRKGVSLFGGVRAMELGLTEKAVTDLHTEYSDVSMSVEVVSSVEQAVAHIHKYGSGHTESIVTNNAETARKFLQSVDSACIFHNASTRFADGFRFGLGAEVGISTGRIHARGPVGVQGLLTYKWLLNSQASEGHIVADFSTNSSSDGSGQPLLKYTHTILNDYDK